MTSPARLAERHGTDHVIRKIIEEVSPDFHSHGSLHPDVLWNIVQEHRFVDARISMETGCGLSTLVLSHLSNRHTVFVLPQGDSMQNTQSNAYLRSAGTNFVVGPSQIMVPKWQFADPLDFVLLDGPHSYPFPDLEYYYVYPYIRQGGVLVIDDIHIPSIHRMYEILRDDDMWEHRGDVRTTAFFRRTDKPLFDPLAGDWFRQRYNRRRFASPEALEPHFGLGWHQREFGPQADAAQTTATDGRDLTIAELNAQIRALKQSTSWRITSPLRRLADGLRRKT